jgi:hypothetical protein
MEPKIIWTSKSGDVRIVETFHDDYSQVYVETSWESDRMGQPIWRTQGDDMMPVVPDSALRELLVLAGLRTDEMD